MEVWKMLFLFKGMIFMFHVSFRGSTFNSGVSMYFTCPWCALQATKKTVLSTRDAPCLSLAFYDLCCLAGVFHVCLDDHGGEKVPVFFWRFKTGEMSRSWLKCKVAKFSFRVFSKENWSIWDLGDIFICLQNPHCLAQKKWGWDGGAKHAKLKSLWIIHERQAERFMRRPFSLELFRCIMPSGYGNRHGKLPTAVAP